jgi:hypothetical protein
MVGKGEKNFSGKDVESSNDLQEAVVVGFKNQDKEERSETSHDATNDLHEVTVTGYKLDETTGNKVFVKAEISPSFPGGSEKWQKYLSVNAKAGVPTENGAPAGIYKAIVQFIVKEDGSISDVKAITNHGYGMEDEAMRLIKKGPKWIPAKQNGLFVRAYVKQPITFQVLEEVTDNPITKSN